MIFRPTFEAKEGIFQAGNNVETLNQQVQGSIPWRLTKQRIWLQDLV